VRDMLFFVSFHADAILCRPLCRCQQCLSSAEFMSKLRGAYGAEVEYIRSCASLR